MSSLLVDAPWLEAHLDDPQVSIIDASVDIVPRPPGPSDYVSRHAQFERAHIPGAHYLHMVDDLSDPAGDFAFTQPQPGAVEQLLSERGIGTNQTVVLYGGQVHWAVHRCWWVLAAAGVQDVRLLDCSFAQWQAQGRAVAATGPAEGADQVHRQSAGGAASGSGLRARPWHASKDDVVASLSDPGTALVNSLSAEQFAGRGQPFGRPGRIPGSISVPAASLIDPDTGSFRSTNALHTAFDAAGAFGYDRLITYCGGGIAASTTFFALQLLGMDNVTLYDGSLLEWSADPKLPLERD